MKSLFALILAFCALPSFALECDVNNDGAVNATDLSLIRARNNTPATGANDPYDANHDGVVNVADWQYCRTRQTAAINPFSVSAPVPCDLNGDGLVTDADLLLIRGRLNTPATGPSDPYDANGDGVVNVADMRYCQLRKTASTGSKAGPLK